MGTYSSFHLDTGGKHQAFKVVETLRLERTYKNESGMGLTAACLACKKQTQLREDCKLEKPVFLHSGRKTGEFPK